MQLTYLSHIPANPNPETKAIFMLHGVGSNERDLFALKEHFEDSYIFSLRGPFVRDADSYAWYPVDFSTGKTVYDFRNVKESIHILMETVESIQKEFHILPENTYLLGFSQGAIMNYIFGIMHSEKIGGIICLSGRLLKESRESEILHKDLRIFIGHGIYDTNIHHTESEEARNSLIERGMDVTFHTYPIKHSISGEEILDIQHWLQKNPLE